MKLTALTLVLLGTVCSGCLNYGGPETMGFGSYRGYESRRADQEQDAGEPDEAKESGPGFLHVALLYLPNRLFDMLDVVRMRVRVGPGFSVSARATKPLSAYAGAHTAVYAGFPGPRGGRAIPLPVGFEAQGGAQVSVADATEGVHYSPTEVGVGAQLFILGFDLGVDPVVELFDLVGGFLTFDPADDDF